MRLLTRLFALAFAFVALASTSATAANLKQLGHDPLLNRGMNAAIAVHGDYAYVGSRTDGSHPNAGVMVVDISKPRDPRIVREMQPPFEGNVSGSHTETLVPDLENDRLLVYSNSSSGATSPTSCRGFDIVAVPLDAVRRLVPPVRAGR